MVRLGEIDNFKCDGLAMVARGISSDNGYLRWECNVKQDWLGQVRSVTE